MKSLSRTVAIATLCSIALFSCSQEKMETATEEHPVEIQAGVQRPGNYAVHLGLTSATGTSTWTYTIKKENKAKDIGYFVLNLGSCGENSPTISNIIAAKVNGVDWMEKITASNGNMQCNIESDNFVKFDNLPAAEAYTIEFTLDSIYAQVPASGWIKAGATCSPMEIQGPGCKGYQLTTLLNADSSLAGKLYNELNSYARISGFDYTEHPHCSGGYGGHRDGVHLAAEKDDFLNKYVFRFNIHIDPVIDGDRCSSGTVDRQRNELKSATNNNEWAKVQGNWDEWQILEWNFKLPAGFQPTSSFCHIHQLKAQDGPNNGSPVITITPRANSNGSNKRMQIIHSVDGAKTGKGTIVDNIPLADFENEWVSVREEMHYAHKGYYSCKIVRLHDGKVLVDFRDTDIDMWRTGSSYIRSKFGIYRSLGAGRLNQNPVGQNPLLKNESIWLSDLRVYEKNPNPNPGATH